MSEDVPNTLIWSDEHRAYWRPEACGYTTNPGQAGVWRYADAERLTRHCGPEKKIQLRLRHEVPEIIRAAAFVDQGLDAARLFYAYPDRGATHDARLRCGVAAFLRAIPPHMDIGTVYAAVKEAVYGE